MLGRPVEVLCYPYGKRNAAVRSAACEAGYRAAVIARQRMNSASTDLFRLRRLWIDYRTTLEKLRWNLFRLRWLAWA
jgi:hypothetical protein